MSSLQLAVFSGFFCFSWLVALASDSVLLLLLILFSFLPLIGVDLSLWCLFL